MNSKAVSALLWFALLSVTGASTASEHDITYICNKLSIFLDTFTKSSNIVVPYNGGTTADGFTYYDGSIQFIPSTSNISAPYCKMYIIRDIMSAELEFFQGINITLNWERAGYVVAKETTIKMVFRVYKESNYYIIKPVLSEFTSLGEVTTKFGEDVTDEAEVVIRPILSNNFDKFCTENFTFSILETDTSDVDWLPALKVILKNELLGLYNKTSTNQIYS